MHKNVGHAFDRSKFCLDDVKKWLSVSEFKLNPAKLNSLFLVQKHNLKNETNLF